MAYEDVKIMVGTLLVKLIANDKFSYEGEDDIAPLITTLGDGSDDDKSEAAKLLQKHVAYNERKSNTFVWKGGLPLLIALIRDGTAEGKTEATKALRYLARYYSNTIGREGG